MSSASIGLVGKKSMELSFLVFLGQGSGYYLVTALASLVIASLVEVFPIKPIKI